MKSTFSFIVYKKNRKIVLNTGWKDYAHNVIPTLNSAAVLHVTVYTQCPSLYHDQLMIRFVQHADRACRVCNNVHSLRCCNVGCWGGGEGGATLYPLPNHHARLQSTEGRVGIDQLLFCSTRCLLVRWQLMNL